MWLVGWAPKFWALWNDVEKYCLNGKNLILMGLLEDVLGPLAAPLWLRFLCRPCKKARKFAMWAMRSSRDWRTGCRTECLVFMCSRFVLTQWHSWCLQSLLHGFVFVQGETAKAEREAASAAAIGISIKEASGWEDATNQKSDVFFCQALLKMGLLPAELTASLGRRFDVFWRWGFSPWFQLKTFLRS